MTSVTTYHEVLAHVVLSSSSSVVLCFVLSKADEDGVNTCRGEVEVVERGERLWSEVGESGVEVVGRGRGCGERLWSEVVERGRVKD